MNNDQTKNSKYNDQEYRFQEIRYQEWYTLQEAANLKGVNVKTLYNNRNLMPNYGIYEGKIGGRFCFCNRTVLNWLALSDEDIKMKS